MAWLALTSIAGFTLGLVASTHAALAARVLGPGAPGGRKE
jgi:hypothetical protein